MMTPSYDWEDLGDNEFQNSMLDSVDVTFGQSEELTSTRREPHEKAGVFDTKFSPLGKTKSKKQSRTNSASVGPLVDREMPTVLPAAADIAA